MSQINANINSDLDEEFRKAVFAAKGMRRGAVSEAIHEALELWISKQHNKKID